MKKIVAILTAVLTAAFLAVYLASVGTAGNAAQSGDPLGDQARPERLDVPALSVDELGETRVTSSLAALEGSVHLMIELEDAPTTQVYAQAQVEGVGEATSAAQAQLARIEAAQEALLPSLEAVDASVLFRTQRVFNGIAVVVDADRIVEIVKMPGVKSVEQLPIHELEHSTSVPLIGAPELWDPSELGLTGSGITIGIIDTGIDYLHANFGGEGAIDPDLYDDNDTTVIGDVPGFPGAKVVGGYDFVGDNYDASGDAGSPVPDPDPDPMDCNGHGTHVAGTAAGYGVNDDGTTYTGAYTETMPFDSFRIAPGVAPEADLYALRVFGCEGSTAVTVEAIEWAVDPNGDGDFSDHLDVINMSLGSPYGRPDDSTAVASNNAADVGVVVVASAGNSADTYYVTGSPAAADRALSVASSIDAGARLGAFEVLEPMGLADLYPASEAAFGPDLDDIGPVTGTLVLADDDVGIATDACSPLTNAGAINGNIALIDRGSCTFVSKVLNAQDAGAIGVLIVNNVSGADPITMGGDDPDVTIPSMMTTSEVGDDLKAALPGVEVVLTAEYRGEFLLNIPERVDTLSDFTSRGPRGDSYLKPDITAPGETIFSAASGTGAEGVSFNGTSMAAPHASGVMALMRELHPDWTVEELKALVMNTALHDLRVANDLDSTKYGPGRVGAGRIDANYAAQSDVVAYSGEHLGMVSVNFGELEVLDETTMTRNVRVVNKGGTAVTFEAVYDPMVDIPGVEYTVSPSTISLGANGVTEVTITMDADPAAMQHTHDPSVPTDVLGIPRHWISEEAGYLRLMPAVTTFSAELSGLNEAPPVTTTAEGMAWFTYTHSTGVLSYTLDVSDISNETMAHIHAGLPGVNGGVIHWLFDATGSNAPAGPFPVSGTVTPSQSEVLQLLAGSLYVNVHTDQNPGGEVRGQIELNGTTPLRVPIYATARPASDMHAVEDSLDLLDMSEITLAGQDVDTGSDYPTDTLSLVSALELQEISPYDGSTEVAMADLAYVGAATDFGATGAITDTWVFFGIATHGDWTTPSDVEFDIYIDVDQDGTPDYALFNLHLEPFGYSADSFYTWLVDLNTGAATPQVPLNGLLSTMNTNVYNTNVMVQGVYAADLGLTEADSSFDYYIVSYSNHHPGVVDVTGDLTYDATNPGLDFSGGIGGLPIWPDLDGATIPVDVNLPAYNANDSQGVLLLHHHNASDDRAEVLLDQGGGIIYLPIIHKH